MDAISTASSRLSHSSGVTYQPNGSHRETYDALYQEYVRLHDLFGRGGDDVIRRLKRIQLDAARAVAIG